jgi:hypothetical protein
MHSAITGENLRFQSIKMRLKLTQLLAMHYPYKPLGEVLPPVMQSLLDHHYFNSLEPVRGQETIHQLGSFLGTLAQRTNQFDSVCARFLRQVTEYLVQPELAQENSTSYLKKLTAVMGFPERIFSLAYPE